jgi:hypothetical protein
MFASLAPSPSLHADATQAALAEAMARAEHFKERVLVTRDGRPVAAGSASGG